MPLWPNAARITIYALSCLPFSICKVTKKILLGSKKSIGPAAPHAPCAIPPLVFNALKAFSFSLPFGTAPFRLGHPMLSGPVHGAWPGASVPAAWKAGCNKRPPRQPPGRPKPAHSQHAASTAATALALFKCCLTAGCPFACHCLHARGTASCLSEDPGNRIVRNMAEKYPSYTY